MGDGCNDGSCGCGDDLRNGPFATDDDSFHPLGSDWEEEMRERLEETEYDADLGMEMARDAQRLVAGEISEEEFHSKYHEAVIEEFEVDDRPTAEAFEDLDVDPGEGLEEALKSFEGDEDQSRREVMKKMGLGAAAVGLGGMATRENGDTAAEPPVAANNHDADEGINYGMVIDLERCDGCLQCVVGCMNENQWASGANWMYVLTFEDENTEEENFLVRPCQHCNNAPCDKVCPVNARHTREKDGLVLTDYETCIGCRYCQVACPYGVNYFGWHDPAEEDDKADWDEINQVPESPRELRQMSIDERRERLQEYNDHMHDERGRWVDSRPPKGVMGKCTMCPSRQDGNMGEDAVGTVACADACDTAGMSAIHFGDMNDPESRPRQYLQRREDVQPTSAELAEQMEGDEEWVNPDMPDERQKMSAFRLLEDMGTDPSVVYIGHEPGENAEQVEGPVSYDALPGTQDSRKDALDEWTIGITGGD